MSTELHLLDAEHFALEDHVDVIASHMRRFLDVEHAASSAQARVARLVTPPGYSQIIGLVARSFSCADPRG